VTIQDNTEFIKQSVRIFGGGCSTFGKAVVALGGMGNELRKNLDYHEDTVLDVKGSGAAGLRAKAHSQPGSGLSGNGGL